MAKSTTVKTHASSTQDEASEGGDAGRLSALRALNILDVESGLRRALGNSGSYIGYVRRFIASQADTPDGIERALERDDWEVAERLAHTLRGTAGNIGANEVAELAQATEMAVGRRESKLQVHIHLHRLQVAMERCVLGLTTVLTEEVEPQSMFGPLPVNEVDYTELQRQMIEFLESDDAAAASLFLEHRAAWKMVLGDKYASFNLAMSVYDYESAVKVLR